MWLSSRQAIASCLFTTRLSGVVSLISFCLVVFVCVCAHEEHSSLAARARGPSIPQYIEHTPFQGAGRKFLMRFQMSARRP